MSPRSATVADFEDLAASITERLAANKRVRRNLPGGGRIRIDRQLPFLCVYRSPTSRPDIGTRDLVTTEAAYLFASSDPIYHEGLSLLCREIDSIMREIFGVFLLIEIWSKEPSDDSLRPSESLRARIITPDSEHIPSAIDALESSLSEICIAGETASITVESKESVAPPGLDQLIPTSGGTFSIGLEVSAIYRDAGTNVLYPVVLQTLRKHFAKAFRRAVFAFTDRGLDEHAHFESLGPTALTRAARETDQQLCEIAATFDFLLQVTPSNSALAWTFFQDGKYRHEPQFHYRPLPYHPNLIKRQLFEVPIERIEDITLAHLCLEKQNELDRQLTALNELETPNFRYASLQLYGPVEDALFDLANSILELFPREPSGEQKERLDPAQVVTRAESEFEYYRKKLPEFAQASVQRGDVTAGLMVSQGRLLVADTVQLRPDRLEALMHHEVGTHLLTYFNGKRQPFTQLSAGLAGYEPLQEGLAVLAEYLVGGLTASRWRSLAGRVVAVRLMTDGETFVDVFNQLHKQYEFTARTAFTMTLRVFRGGGLTKDAIYLRGLHELLGYLNAGHDLEPLYVGKIGLHHVPYIRELRRRGIIQPPGALPRFWNHRSPRERLEACRNLTLLQLAEQQR